MHSGHTPFFGQSKELIKGLRLASQPSWSHMIEIKTVVVGDTDAGKTSLSERFCYGDAPASASPTIGASFLQKRVYVQDEHREGSHNVYPLCLRYMRYMENEHRSRYNYGTPRVKNVFGVWLRCIIEVRRRQ